MKLYIMRDTAAGGGFSVLNDIGNEKYIIPADPNHALKFTIRSMEGNSLSVIKYNRMMFNYFTIRCKRMYALVPFLLSGECFSFAIYGSTCHFAGSLAQGDFSMTDSSGKLIMTQSRCIGIPKSRISKFNDGWELKFIPEDICIYGENFEIFALSTAICADMYITATPETKGMLLGY